MHDNTSSIFTIATTIFFTFNAIGNIPVFIALLRKYPPKRQLRIIFREVLIALVIMLLFSYYGQGVLGALKISMADLRIGGGVILFLIALDMIFPRHTGELLMDDEPFIVPLAIPILSGAGTITTIMLYAHEEQNETKMLLAIALAWIPSLMILMLSSYLRRLLGDKILLALERLMGMMLTFIALQMMGVGIMEYALALARSH